VAAALPRIMPRPGSTEERIASSAVLSFWCSLSAKFKLPNALVSL
jgi:hypothetical protein